MDNRPWTALTHSTQPDTMSYTDTHIACIMYTCNTNPYIAMSICMVIIVILNMLIFAVIISCYDHDNCDYCMLCCLMYCDIFKLYPNALDNLIVNTIIIGRNNKISHGCIFGSRTVLKDHENFNPLVLTGTTRLNKVYLFININPVLKLLKISSKCPFSIILIFKNIKNHGIIGLTLKTEVFNTIFLLDLDSEMSTKSCARILKNTCFSSITHPQKTALKNNFLTVSFKFLLKTANTSPTL